MYLVDMETHFFAFRAFSLKTYLLFRDLFFAVNLLFRDLRGIITIAKITTPAHGGFQYAETKNL